MIFINEHECETLKFQNIIDKSSIMAVQEMVRDDHNNKNEPVKYLGWYLVNYCEHRPNTAFAIKFCPYCGKKLRKS